MRKYFFQLVITAVCALAIFLIGFSAGVARSSFVSQPSAQVVPAKSISLLINNGEYVKSYTGLPLPQPPTLLKLLENSSTREGYTVEVDKASSLGAFVKQIGDKANGQGQMYWQYYVNGSQPQVAANRFILQGGETVLWTFSKSER